MRISLGLSSWLKSSIRIRPPLAPQQNVFAKKKRHIDQLDAASMEHMPGSFRLAVVAAEVAGVMIRHFVAELPGKSQLPARQ